MPNARLRCITPRAACGRDTNQKKTEIIISTGTNEFKNSYVIKTTREWNSIRQFIASADPACAKPLWPDAPALGPPD